MDWTHITSSLIAALVGSGAASAWFTYKINKSKNRRESFEKIVAIWDEDNKRLRQRVDELEIKLKEEIAKVIRLEIELAKLQNHL